MFECLCAIPEHIQPLPLVAGFNAIRLGQDRDGSLSRLVELTDQLTTPLVLGVGYGDSSAISQRPEK